MSNSTCSISSINDILIQAQQNRLNITSTVASCPNICSLAWGNGNPDLSGIGVNISYILHAILTVFIGPLFCVMYERCHRWTHCEESKRRIEKHISSFHDSFVDVSAQFILSIIISAVIRIRQQATFYELAFLRALTTMQFLSLLCITVTVGLFKEPYDRSLRRIVIIVLYGLLDFGFYMGLVGSLIASNAGLASIIELSNACKAYGQIFPWIKHIPSAHGINVPHVTAKEYFSPFSKKGWKFGLIIWGLVTAGIVALCLAFFIVPMVFLALSNVLSGKKCRWLVIVMSSAFAIAMLVELWEMERTRNVMKEISGSGFLDNEWGFGQFIAILLWIPFYIQFAYYTISIGYNVYKHHREKHDVEKCEITGLEAGSLTEGEEKKKQP